MEALPEALEGAFRVAMEGRPGPVLVDVPKDVQLARYDGVLPVARLMDRPSAPSGAALAEARALLETSQRPVIYAGGGVALADAVEPFRHFVETTGLPVVLTLKGLGNLSADHPQNLGMLGMHGSVAANRAVQESDLLVVVGARFDDRVRNNFV